MIRVKHKREKGLNNCVKKYKNNTKNVQLPCKSLKETTSSKKNLPEREGHLDLLSSNVYKKHLLKSFFRKLLIDHVKNVKTKMQIKISST